MYELTIRSHFDSAHFLRNYQGKCAQIHGHCWQIEVTVFGDQLDNTGMVIDFSVLKAKTNEIVDRLDHRLINDLPEFQEGQLNPTAENLAQYIFNQIKKGLADFPVRVGWVRVWESANASATYREE